MFEIVKKAIDAWDFAGLLETHAPNDEYDSESREIAVQINTNSSVDEIGGVIFHVFQKAFGDLEFLSLSYEECLVVAKKLKGFMK